MLGLIIVLVGVLFFCDTILPEKYKDTRYRILMFCIPGSFTFTFLYDYLIRGVRWNPDYKPMEHNFKVSNEELKMFIYNELLECYKISGKEKIESAFDIKIFKYGTPQGSKVFNIQYKAKLDGKWTIQGLAVDEDVFIQWLNQ